MSLHYLQQFCHTIDRWTGFLPGYSLEQLCQRPHPGSWSSGQVYLHLIQDTRFFVEQMEAALAASPMKH
ncbi:DinB family protein [Chitinophaga horti]|uniref:DinB family protein n=1 Tax=Chitinophaga horti TaxID=2920382 RepID=A0ABY6J7N7_9BACT|nr:DinB family protein [Chitinophaga horti]UYQ95705.1 DinB family protein [Chitinophaga horti]